MGKLEAASKAVLDESRIGRIKSIRKMATHFASDAASGMTWWEYRTTVTKDMLWLLDLVEEGWRPSAVALLGERDR